MTNNTFKISIKNRCSENWDTMLPVEKGKHCLSCQKTVVDFTTMTDGQIIQYFQNYQGKTCGRFLETQVNRPILPPVLPKNQTRWAWLFSVLLLPMSAKAQQTTEFDIEKVSKLVLDSENKAKATHKVKVPMKDEQIGEHRFDINHQFELVTLTGDIDREEEPPIPHKTSEDILQDFFTSLKSLIMNLLSFFK